MCQAINEPVKVKVVFRQYRSGEVLALFPEVPATFDPGTCLCCASVRQHAAADPQIVIQGTRPASAEASRPLACELVRIGYVLQEVRRVPTHALKARRAAIHGTRAA